MSECPCPLPEGGEFWCERHQCTKTRLLREKCQEGGKWRDAWDRGKGPGQKWRTLPTRPRRTAIQSFPVTGTGTHLKRMLERLGITHRQRCQCGAHASEMNRNGPDWCERNMDLILGWMRTEARKRKLPFVRTVARQLVRVAIARARRELRLREDSL